MTKIGELVHPIGKFSDYEKYILKSDRLKEQ